MTSRNLVLCGCAALCILAASARSQDAKGGFVQTRGRELIGPDGRPLLLRGINLGNWLVPEGYMFKFEKGATSPGKIEEVINELIGPEEAAVFWSDYRDSYITRDDIRWIKRSGLNSVRVPFHYRLLTNEGSADGWNEDGFAVLQRLVHWCTEEGIWVILDMHCAPGGQTGDNIDDSWGYPWLLRSPNLQDQTVKIWSQLARRFKDEKAVIGYDLLNEPIAAYFDTLSLNRELEPFYKRIVAGIRMVDSNHVIFLGGSQWDTNFKIFGPPFDRNLAYTFHRYWTDTTEQELRQYLDFRDRYRVPVWMGESGENSNAWISGFRRMVERDSIGWCFWPYKKAESKSCLMTFSLPPGYASIVKFAETDRADFAQIREAMPDRALVRRVLHQIIENCRFENCSVNEGFVLALGLPPGGIR
ncbi:MAG TPA: cellulase family glycosylhydrolase [Bacteroidota bacterium]|nr:cellulase family glycosylhydrolase [Bacteroidota bacterium]